jgi:hypothetical protein
VVVQVDAEELVRQTRVLSARTSAT